MGDELDIRLILPFLNHRLNGPMYVSFITLAELGCAALFIVFSIRILYIIRNMATAQNQEQRDRKLNELMENIAKLEREVKEKSEQRKQKRKAKKMKDDDSRNDEEMETEANSSHGDE
ncbi:uncharacterized protein LOC119079004 [Bradysia coprophila]|uniref:uncharacterized protein LOC119079004 n=1 Tax=Bradysia coprophila TaxID=38358 RepID=UPI00187DCE62|nr:uncharacterized protein LOC119079004 [Bradysia coprophila]